MKKILIYSGLFIATSLTGNPIVDVLNQMHKISNKYWKHQREEDIDAYSRVWNKKGFVFPTRKQDPEEKYLKQKRDDLPRYRIGGTVEGIGELADVATVTAANSKILRIANMLALLSRASDIAMGSFPELSRMYLDAQGRPCSYKKAVRSEKPRLRFWATEWQQVSPGKTEKIIPLYLASLGINQVGKAFDIKRAYDRIKNARLLAWYNSKLSKKERMRLHIEQVVHAALLIAGLVTKYKQEQRYVTQRYPWLIGEALISFLRRWRMRHVQNDLLDRARMAAERERKTF